MGQNIRKLLSLKDKMGYCLMAKWLCMCVIRQRVGLFIFLSSKLLQNFPISECMIEHIFIDLENL